MSVTLFRKYYLLIVLLLATSSAIVANGVNTIIKGQVHNAGTQSVSLYKVENGEAIRLGFQWPAKDGSFSFNTPLEKESIFFITKTTGHLGDLKYVLYVKPGVEVSLDLYSNNISIDYDSCRIKEINQETCLLQQWMDLFMPVCRAGRNMQKRESFFLLYDQLKIKAENFKSTIRTSNNFFNKLMRQKIDVDVDYARAAAFFYFNERLLAAHDTALINRKFYAPVLQKGKYCDAFLLNTDHGMKLLKYYTSIRRFFSAKSIDEFQQEFSLPSTGLICNDTLKGAFVINEMQKIFTYEELIETIRPYEKYFLTTTLRSAYIKKKKELQPFAKGAEAYNFSLPDVNDKLVSLSDYKGKVVVVDMWAMWCAPCLEEKPYFQKIEKEYKNYNDVVFVSVSVDGFGKKDPWKNFIRKRSWNGIELLSNHTESLMKYYSVEGIPRLMIFDKMGKIVTVNAPRPSENEFRMLIEQTLKKNS